MSAPVPLELTGEQFWQCRALLEQQDRLRLQLSVVQREMQASEQELQGVLQTLGLDPARAYRLDKAARTLVVLEPEER